MAPESRITPYVLPTIYALRHMLIFINSLQAEHDRDADASTEGTSTIPTRWRVGDNTRDDYRTWV